jgi:hypothetical protein
VQLRQTEVEDQQVELVGTQGGVGLAPAADLIDRIAGVPERTEQAVGQHLVVLGNQYPHRCLLGAGSRHLRLTLGGVARDGVPNRTAPA